MRISPIPKRASILVFISLFANPANSSAVIDFNTNKVYRINDAIPVVVLAYGSRYVETEDFNQINPAGIRGKSGYATERQIDGENILNQNKGVKNAIITPWFVAGSLEENQYSAKAMLDYVRRSGVGEYRLSINAQKVLSNYQLIKENFDSKRESRSRTFGGPNKRGQFKFR